jgi:Ca2+-binding RTX toxin-like protein
LDNVGATISEAAPVEVGSPIAGTIDISYDRDFYAANMTAGITYAVAMLGSSSGNGTLYDTRIYGTYNSSGILLNYGDDDSGFNWEALLFFTPQSTDTYYFDLGGFGSGNGTFVVAITEGNGFITGTTSNNTLNGSAFTDYIYGSSGNDLLRGYGGDDYLDGGNNNDTLIGGTGKDYLYGGSGSDTFVFAETDAVDIIIDFSIADLEKLNLSGLLSGYTAGISDVDEFIRFQNIGANTLVQVDVDGSVGGENFVDVALLLNLHDVYFSGDPDNVDAQNFGLKNNIINATVLSLDTPVSGNIDNSLYNDLDFYEVVLTGGTTYAISAQGASTGEGTSLAPYIYGVYDSAGDYIAAGNSYSGIGNDALLFYTPGSTGTYYFDIRSSYEGTYAVEVMLGGSNLSGTTSNNTLNGSANTDYLFGSSGNDLLRGYGGDDFLEGSNDNDTLIGGTGRDYLSGGSGSDTFVFAETDAVDIITDFSLAEDSIDISNLLSGYDPLSDLITDFVNVTGSGTDTIVSIDQDGGGDNFVNIALLLNVGAFDPVDYEGTAIITI